MGYGSWGCKKLDMTKCYPRKEGSGSLIDSGGGVGGEKSILFYRAAVILCGKVLSAKRKHLVEFSQSCPSYFIISDASKHLDCQ